MSELNTAAEIPPERYRVSNPVRIARFTMEVRKGTDEDEGARLDKIGQIEEAREERSERITHLNTS